VKPPAAVVGGITPLKRTGRDAAPLVTWSSPVARFLAVIPSPVQAPAISTTVRPPATTVLAPVMGGERASSDITEPTVSAAAVLW